VRPDLLLAVMALDAAGRFTTLEWPPRRDAGWTLLASVSSCEP
jgi:hypothetical protein